MFPRISTLELLIEIFSATLNIKGTIATPCPKSFLTNSNYLTDHKISARSVFHYDILRGLLAMHKSSMYICSLFYYHVCISDYISSLSLSLSMTGK